MEHMIPCGTVQPLPPRPVSIAAEVRAAQLEGWIDDLFFVDFIVCRSLWFLLQFFRFLPLRLCPCRPHTPT